MGVDACVKFEIAARVTIKEEVIILCINTGSA